MRSLRALLPAATAAALLLTGCGPGEPPAITQVVYSQSQAIEGFDGSEASTDDPDRTAALAAILAEHGLSGDIELGENCPGGLSTDVDYTTPDGVYHIDVGGCDQDEAGAAVEELISSWR